jgi:nitrate reductase alpha subunit
MTLLVLPKVLAGKRASAPADLDAPHSWTCTGDVAEPRGCPRGAAFSWYTYSPTRVRYPYARGVLVDMYREAKARLGDPVLAWADVVGDPGRRRTYQQARGKGGLVRVSWDDAVEMVAAAHVHTIKTHGPDRCAGFSPIPAIYGPIDLQLELLAWSSA